MGFSQFLWILRARWRVVAAVLAIAVGTTLLISLLLPKQYTAVASVVVDVKPDPIAGQIYPGLLIPSYLATQVDVLQSDRVARRVVQNLKLLDNPQLRQQWMDATGGTGSEEAWLSDSLQTSLEVKPSKESNVINVSYKSPDPRFAAALANAFVQAYLDTTVDLRVDPAKQYSTFFEQRAKELRANLEKAQQRLSDFEREKGLIASDERFDLENNHLNELTSQLVMAQAQQADSGSREAQAGSGDEMREVIENPLIAGVKADLSREEAKLQELNSRLGDRNPQVIEQRATVEALRNRLATETHRIAQSVGQGNRIAQQRVAQIKAQLDAQRQSVLKMQSLRDESALLRRDVDNAQHAYDAVQQRLNQSSLESQTTQSGVSVLTQATPPDTPSSPKIVLNTLLSFIVGLVLACGAAFGLELLDRRVRGVDDVATAVGLPVLGIMPTPQAKKTLGRPRVPMMQHRLLTSLPGPTRGE
jgi:chain length determinant protein EpsF